MTNDSALTKYPSNKKKTKLALILSQWDLQLLVIFGVIHVLIFSYVPMYGVLMAFQEFKLGDFPGFSQWVGFKHFEYLFRDPNFFKVLRNTLAISSLKLLICYPLPIVFALFINELRNKAFKKTMQTISYLPHFISWVVAATLLFDLLSVDGGAVNQALMFIKLVNRPIPFFSKGEYFWGVSVVTDLWKELGWNSIIFVAAISSVDTEMYDAANIDGASRIQKMIYVTLGSIRPTIILLFIFTVGGILDANFDQIMLLTNQMSNGILRDYADVIDTYVYRIGIRSQRYSYAMAAGLFKALINFALLLLANFLATRIDEDSAMF